MRATNVVSAVLSLLAAVQKTRRESLGDISDAKSELAASRGLSWKPEAEPAQRVGDSNPSAEHSPEISAFSRRLSCSWLSASAACAVGPSVLQNGGFFPQIFRIQLLTGDTKTLLLLLLSSPELTEALVTPQSSTCGYFGFI